MGHRTTFASTAARFNGRVIFRTNRSGSIWAKRMAAKGQRPSPAALFIPAQHAGTARAFALAAQHAGLQAIVRQGQACAIWASGPLASSAPAWAVKVRLPVGMSAGQARAAISKAWGQLTW